MKRGEIRRWLDAHDNHFIILRVGIASVKIMWFDDDGKTDTFEKGILDAHTKVIEGSEQ